MGIFNRIFGGERKSYDTTVFEAVLAQGGINASGIAVTPFRALECPAVAAAVRVRVESLGSLSLLLYKRDDADERSRAVDHPLYRILHERASGPVSSSEFVMEMETDVLLEGAGYALASRASDDRILELIRLDPTAVTCKRDPNSMEPYYEVRDGMSRTRRYRWFDILHIRGSIDFANRKDARPLSAVRQARTAIGLTMAIEGHLSRMMSRGAKPSGALSAGAKRLDDVARKRLRESMRAHEGDNSGGTILLEDGLTFVQTQFTSTDLQLAELRIQQQVEIGRALAVPPVLIYEMGRATFGNFESLVEAYKVFTLLGRAKIWGGAISRLLSEQEQREFYPEFEIDSLARATLDARYAAYAQACGGPWLTVDEVRGTDNRSSIPGGDVLRPPANASGVITPPARPKPGLSVVAS
jgi:HK97 family phage portal protein